MMQLKLTRDQARMIQAHFLPYMLRVCEMRVMQASSNLEELLTCKTITALMQVIKLKFDRKLLTTSVRFTFRFTDAEGITLYKMLMAMPIDSIQVFMLQLRQICTDTLYKQICEPQ